MLLRAGQDVGRIVCGSVNMDNTAKLLGEFPLEGVNPVDGHPCRTNKRDEAWEERITNHSKPGVLAFGLLESRILGEAGKDLAEIVVKPKPVTKDVSPICCCSPI